MRVIPLSLALSIVAYLAHGAGYAQVSEKWIVAQKSSQKRYVDKETGKEKEKKPTPAPKLSGLSLQSGPPGTEVTISGSGFSKTPAENKVFFGDIQAGVSSGDARSITTVIPSMDYPRYGVPVTVQVGDSKKSNALSIKIQNRVF